MFKFSQLVLTFFSLYSAASLQRSSLCRFLFPSVMWRSLVCFPLPAPLLPPPPLPTTSATCCCCCCFAWWLPGSCLFTSEHSSYPPRPGLATLRHLIEGDPRESNTARACSAEVVAQRQVMSPETVSATSLCLPLPVPRRCSPFRVWRTKGYGGSRTND